MNTVTLQMTEMSQREKKHVQVHVSETLIVLHQKFSMREATVPISLAKKAVTKLKR